LKKNNFLTKFKILKLTSGLAIGTGLILVSGGVWGIFFTYTNVAQENIITSSDASLPNQPVRGPITLKAQSEIIRQHVLGSTDGLTYSDLPREISITDNDGKSRLISNPDRDLWVTAITLMTALNLAIITYLFSGLVILLGLISIWTGFVFRLLGQKK